MVEQINDDMLVYHGGSEVVENPEIRIGRYKKDFYWGFYCTILPTQADVTGKYFWRNFGK